MILGETQKGECGIQYVYRPYHGWRHGYRREKRKRLVLCIAKFLLVAEGVILAGRYVKAHTYEKVYEREVYWTDDIDINGGEGDGGTGSGTFGDNVFGIGFGADDGSLILFHQKSEMTEKEE